MAANQHTATQLAVSIPLAPGSSSSIAAARYPAPEPQTAPVPMSPNYVAGSTPVSTPTSGMHSPPLSSTLEEEANEKRAAHVASSINRSQPSELGKTSTPFSAAATATTSSGNSNRSLSGSSRSGGERRSSPSVTAATSSKSAKARPGAKITQVKNQVGTQMYPSGASDRPRDSNSSPHSVGLRTAVDHHFRPDLHQVRRPLSKEKTIEHVLQQGKILKVSTFYIICTLFSRHTHTRTCSVHMILCHHTFHFSARVGVVFPSFTTVTSSVPRLLCFPCASIFLGL